MMVGLELEQPVLDELVEPGGGGRLAEFGAADELLEASRAVEGLAHQQERGSGGEQLDAFRDRATGAGCPAVARGELSRHAPGRSHGPKCNWLYRALAGALGCLPMSSFS